jgi:hypothetical protein
LPVAAPVQEPIEETVEEIEETVEEIEEAVEEIEEEPVATLVQEPIEETVQMIIKSNVEELCAEFKIIKRTHVELIIDELNYKFPTMNIYLDAAALFMKYNRKANTVKHFFSHEISEIIRK